MLLHHTDYFYIFKKDLRYWVGVREDNYPNKWCDYGLAWDYKKEKAIPVGPSQLIEWSNEDE